MGFTWQRLVRVCACAAIFAIGLLGTLLVSSESAWTQLVSTTVPSDPPPITTDPLPTTPDPDPPPPPPPPKQDDPPPPNSGGSGDSGGTSGPTSEPQADTSGPSATTGAKKATKPKASKPKKKKKKKKKRVRVEQAFVAPVHAPRDPPGAVASVGGASAFTTNSSSNGLAVPIAVVMLGTIAVGAAFLLMLAAMPVRNLAGVSVRLAQRRGEVGLVTICFLLASIVGFVLAVMSA